MKRIVMTSVFLATALTAQQQQSPSSRDTVASTMAARKAEVSARVVEVAAAARLASIRGSLGTMLTDARLAAARSKGSGELAAFEEDEILKAIAEQLEQFIAAYKATDEAEAARALLARIYVKLGRVDDAVRVLKDFDIDRAMSTDMLQLAMSMAAIEQVAADVDKWVKEVGTNGDQVVDRFDALFVAMRLGKLELAEEILKDIHSETKAPVDHAMVLLYESELVSRLGIRNVVPVMDPEIGPAKKFLVNPVVAEQVALGRMPVGTWREIEPVDSAMGVADTARREQAMTEKLYASKPYVMLVGDAAAGLRIMQTMAAVDPLIEDALDERTIPTHDGAVPVVMPSAGMVSKGLLYKIVHQYPGTEAARIAGYRLQADDLRIGRQALPIDVETTGGKCIGLPDLLGKVVLLDFFAVADPECVKQLAEMKELKKLYEEQGLEIVGISLDMDCDAPLLRSAIETFAIDWPIVHDGKGVHAEVAQIYGVQALPARLLIGRDGKIVEDRAWKLAIDRLAATVQAAVEAPVKTLPVEEAAELIEEPYVGTPIAVELGVDVESGQRQLAADAWVVDSGYEFTLERVAAVDGAASVFLKLKLGKARAAATADTLLQRRLVIPLDPTIKGVVKVYVDATLAETTAAAKPKLVEVICVPENPVPAGMKIVAELMATDSLPPQYSLNLSSPLAAAGASIQLDGIVRGKDVTEVRVTLKSDPTAKDPGGKRLHLYVPLGTDVAPVITVMVQSIDASTGKATEYQRAAKLSRD